MKIVRGEEDKVMILRNKRKGLRLLIREDINPKMSGCQNDCYLWNNPLCNKKPCGKAGLWEWGRSYHFVKDQ